MLRNLGHIKAMNQEHLKYYQLTKVTKRDLEEGIWDAEHKGLYSKDGKRLLRYQINDTTYSGQKYDCALKPGLEVICDGAFQCYGSYLRSIKFPDTVVAIGDRAFAKVFMKRFVLPKNIKYFGDHIFGSLEGVFDIVFEEGLTEVDFGKVLDFGSAITIYIPSTLSSIGSSWENNSTVAIHVAEGNKHFCVADDVLYDYNKTLLIRCPVSKRGVLKVPEGVTTIRKNAFRRCGTMDIDLSTVSVPKMTVVLSESVERIETGAFMYSALSSLYIGQNVHFIGDNAFNGHFIKDIIVSPYNPYYESCQGMLIDKRTMTLVTISGNFTGKNISHDFFRVENNVLIDKKRRTALTTIGYSNDNSNAFVNDYDFDDTKPGINYLKDVTIPTGIEIINNHAIYGDYKSIVIPEGVTYIADDAFKRLYASSISLPSTLCYLNPSAIKDIITRGYQPGQFTVLVPKGLLKKLEKMKSIDDAIKGYFKEIGNEERLPSPTEKETTRFLLDAKATEADFKDSSVGKYMLRYSKDGKKLLKFEGYHYRHNKCEVAEGTEIICDNANASVRTQHVKTFIVPASVKYIGCCPPINRILLYGNNTRFAPSSILLRSIDTVYIPCGTWNFYYDVLNKAKTASKCDYRLVELSRANVAMYLKQQSKILTDVICCTNIISEYTVRSINGDRTKRYIYYKDKNRKFFLDAEHSNYQQISLLRAIAVMGLKYQDILDILKVDIDKVEVNEENKSSLENKVLASNSIHSWIEDFLDEDTGDIISIERCEVLYPQGTCLGQEEIQKIMDHGIPSVEVYHDLESREHEYLQFFSQYYYNTDDGIEMPIPKTTRDSILRLLFPGRRHSSITDEEKYTMAYNLIILIKAYIDYYGSIEGMLIPFMTNDEDLYNEVSDEEVKLAHLTAEYYQQLINKVMQCKTDNEAMPLFVESQSVQNLKDFLINRNVNEDLFKSLVTPAINIIQME